MGVAIEVCVPQLPFAPPESEAADITISTGEAFYRELSKAGVATKFTDREIRPTFLTDLRADLDNYEGITGNRDDAMLERKDAVSELEGEEEKMIGSFDGLDTLLRNKFQGDKTAQVLKSQLAVAFTNGPTWVAKISTARSSFSCETVAAFI